MGDKKDSPKCINKITPPPSLRKIRNPFDKALIDKLHKPICSPGMCKIYKKKSTGAFRWDIDQHCTLVPADIVACNSQFEPSPDPALEKIAEEATEK
ncbi:Protein aurora borealis [Operophtera brumata]|uniref:Protein aurora borealis n=1 Tax=Operophtera brumata TaxID=104452 RepID=A0A0L7L828_OPEBR|nr:Protein aurora borealis [Operophtera brumata]